MNDTDEITNYEDVIDSRDVIARIAYLECAQNQPEAEEINVGCGHGDAARVTCGTCLSSWCAVCDPTPSDRCPFEADHAEGITEEESGELTLLRELAAQGETFRDWAEGVTLVRYSYFKTYAQEFHEESSDNGHSESVQWPYTCIDWDQAAHELAMDYTTVEFDEVAYFGR